jgi:hypothetical protein
MNIEYKYLSYMIKNQIKLFFTLLDKELLPVGI